MANEVDTLVNTILKTRIVEALNSSSDAIEKLVQSALEKPVDETGGNRGYGAKMPFLDYLVGEEIRNATRKAVVQIVQEHAAVIEAKVRQGLSEDSIVRAVTKAFVSAASEEWKIKVEFAAEKRD